MLVIEGKAGKIIEIDKMLKDMDINTTLFINISEMTNPETALSNPFAYVYTAEKSVWRTVDYIMSNVNDFKKFKTIIFYANCNINDIKHIRAVEVELGARCIVTVQNSESEELKIYEI